MKKVRVTLVIDQLHSIVDKLIDLIPTLENQHTQYKIEQLSHIETTLAKELETSLTANPESFSIFLLS